MITQYYLVLLIWSLVRLKRLDIVLKA